MKSLPHSGRPRAVALSKRANVFYLERCKVIQKDERVVYLTDTGQNIEKLFNIPDKNTLFLLLGTGTSITNSAMRKLAESNVMVGFCGSGGSPLIGALDATFILPQDEYRPTEYAQRWFKLWSCDDKRLELGKHLLETRLQWTEVAWKKRRITLPGSLLADIRSRLKTSESATHILTVEAIWAKKLYALLAREYGVEFRRDEGERKSGSQGEIVNSLIDHGNYLAYGYSAAVLHGLGIPFALPILHGKTRRGGLVFDIADLIKDQLVLPLAFEISSEERNIAQADKKLRGSIIDTVDRERLVSKLFDEIKMMTTL
ncbi:MULTISPECIES: type I-F CRISPR-associated endonuclease Cas1f [unclassified Marinobacter]|jgi:CRISPR-associated protein Cas1|uniref:type I-F CRISPR-associated endonuclease Cas1f n=1 Tax=unclassified Marinobacter TaxID=83889 RepID=UPI00200F5179|nr:MULTISPECIES: type I-F CRISPR-associated endonuclease Cas1f [unclassified Marinobacter]MCL1478125.1 type I-F CRISPR-associated endonuclease Cas1f [Marinobacter sp.]MCL1480080.1 type I-F CRISPR-associated endonuclease Cas1f [Marinobacter sp.]MCL1484041.1 type I-F CRISPR-associated endonuclease Cas1f [Marinobacter sp.]MCL1487571.1 type I-F CRISPR-associated endonuclease Cas1f [Marinobacter sp.]UQG55717.1 type I-F CRISPR-associated endonuclease Cas1f [Marinobacter sp. M4C]